MKQSIEIDNTDTHLDSNVYGTWSIMSYEANKEFTSLFQKEVKRIKAELEDIANLWAGHYNFHFDSLTQECLTVLNERCAKVENDISCFRRRINTVLGSQYEDHSCHSAKDYINSIQENEFEIELMKVIRKSFELSSGIPQESSSINQDYWNVLDGRKRYLSLTVKVEPWETLACSKVVAPERPSVILKVLSLSDSAPRVSAGFDDVFCIEPLVRELLVDDDVQVGDHIIVKTSGWSGFGSELNNPEYDGPAEPDCPCSDMGEVLEAKYDFDLDYEEEKQKAIWRINYLEKHFTLKTEDEIRQSGRSALQYIENPKKNVKYSYTSNDMEEYVIYHEQANEYA